MTNNRLLFASIASFLAASVAFAADPPKFKKADTNGDGAVDAAEYANTGIEGKFEKWDEDEDGKLSKEEYGAALGEDCE